MANCVVTLRTFSLVIDINLQDKKRKQQNLAREVNFNIISL